MLSEKGAFILANDVKNSAAGEADLKQRCEICDGSIEFWPRLHEHTGIAAVFSCSAGFPCELTTSDTFGTWVFDGMHQVCGSTTCKSCNSWTGFGVAGPVADKR